MEVIFWVSAIFIFYTYVGYPALLALFRFAAARPVAKAYCEPYVSIVIAAHNESERIENKLRNCLSLDYPRSKLQIIISLDGSTDGTEFLVQKFRSQGVEIVRSREHRGKPSALNNAMRRANGEIVVFADVRQTFERSAIRELVANFADESVGAVSGELMLMDEFNAEARTDVGLYWRYEKTIRSLESDIHSVPGATGAIYAIRRELYQELPEDTLVDDVMTPMRIVLRGKRAVFDSSAKAYDIVACCPSAEFARKVRTLAGNYQLVMQAPELLLPWRNPVFVQFVSHKIARLLVPYALVALIISNIFMFHGVYAFTFGLQCLWYGFAIAGHLLLKPAPDIERPAEKEVNVPAPALFEESKRAA